MPMVARALTKRLRHADYPRPQADGPGRLHFATGQ
jgi:hypothetical protein